MSQLATEIQTALKSAKATAVESYEPVQRLPTGSLIFDNILGGGLARGRFQTISGWESYGKSTIAQFIAAETIRNGGYVCYVDTESSYDHTWAEQMGVDRSHFALIQPEYAEVALDQMTKLIKANVFDLIVWDSIAATPWRYFKDASADDTPIGKHAQKWSQWYVRNVAELRKTKTAFLSLNQLREAIGVRFGDPIYEPGGKSHKFYASIRMRLLKPDVLKVDGRDVGHRFHVRIAKNKTAPVMPNCFVDFVADHKTGIFGLDPISDMVSAGKQLGVFTDIDAVPIAESKKTKWHFLDTELGIGEKATTKFLREADGKLLQEIDTAIRIVINPEANE